MERTKRTRGSLRKRSREETKQDCDDVLQDEQKMPLPTNSTRVSPRIRRANGTEGGTKNEPFKSTEKQIEVNGTTTHSKVATTIPLDNTTTTTTTTAATATKTPDPISSSNEARSSKPSNGRHFTRSKNQQQIQAYTNFGESDVPAYSRTTPLDARIKRKGSPIDSAATILASLDERAYHRSLMIDASCLSRELLIPMSLPWTHSVVPVARNLASDIDELAEVVMSESALYSPYDNGSFGFGRFDLNQLRRGGTSSRLASTLEPTCSAARRGKDPGVIELRTIVLPPNPLNDMDTLDNDWKPPSSDSYVPASTDTPTDNGCVGTARGEVSLECFRHALRLKRRRVSQTMACTRTRYVSVRVNSSSSRASILPRPAVADPIDGADPSVGHLVAILPLEVQNGKFLNLTKARASAEKLGTYNWRHGLGPTHATGKNANRTSVGRTRLMWSEKKSTPEQPQKVHFSSLLTGAKIDSGMHKRPREVKVAVLVDGKMFLEGPKKKKQTHGAKVAAPSAVSMISGDALNSSGDGRIEDMIFTKPLKQCTLETDKLMHAEASKAATSILNVSDQPTKTPPEQTGYKPPVLESIPDSNGIMYVLCTAVGRIPELSFRKLLNEAGGEEKSRCAVCSSGDEAQPSKPENGRSSESLRNGTDTSTSFSQTTSNEAKSIKQADPYGPNAVIGEEPKCILCPFSGGPMSRTHEGLVHDVCRVWTNHMSKKTPKDYSDSKFGVGTVCAICGRGDDVRNGSYTTSDSVPSNCTPVNRLGLVKCAADRCQVYCHPMCAWLTSKLNRSPKFQRSSEEGPQKSEDPSAVAEAVTATAAVIRRDESLCRRFTLTAIDCEGYSNEFGKDPGKLHSVTLPVVFCGVHNPKREPSFYGLPPGGGRIDSSIMTVPRSGSISDA